ncbi:hypothetical protein [Micromonospora sp. KC721]|nr:hypothetical protein [Micromonospora sp. KC721]
MITEYDTALITVAPVEPGIRGDADDLHGEWPNVLVALDGEYVGLFLR